MIDKKRSPLFLCIFLMIISSFFSSCTATTISTPQSSTSTLLPPAPTTLGTSAPTPIPLSTVKLAPGEYYFRVDDKPTFMLSRNPTGKTREDFDTTLNWAHQGGTKIVRVHLTHGWWSDPWINNDWSVNEKWAQDWDNFFDEAQADGIYVIPVFGVWADWNGGTPDWGSPLWQYNPLNSANGGPVGLPGDLFIPDSDTQNHWMEWVKTLVERWQGQQNIIAWEIFSEIDIPSGAIGHMATEGGLDEATGIDFTNKAMTIIHGADSENRPITLSLAGVYSSAGKWKEYYNLDSLDFIEVHYYSDTLDRDLISQVRKFLTEYQKPVLIGESGLWSMIHNANADIGIQHAIWAGMVSGAMNARALWDNDGYYFYANSNRAEAIAFMQAYNITELPIANFTNNIDFSGFQPLTTTYTSGVWGAAVGSEKIVLGWFRDVTCEPPDWTMLPVITNQTVTLTVPGTAYNWKVDFYDTKTGTEIISSTTVNRKDNTITLLFPDFKDDIAFKLYVQE
jgi:hypothetical protein